MKVSLGSLAATAPAGLAGNLPIWLLVSNSSLVSAVPLTPAVKAIAEVDKYCPDVNLRSPSTIATETFFSNKWLSTKNWASKASCIFLITPVVPPNLTFEESVVNEISKAVPPSTAILK